MRLGQQLIDRAGPGEAADCATGQAKAPGDRFDSQPFGLRLLDLVEALPDTGREPSGLGVRDRMVAACCRSMVAASGPAVSSARNIRMMGEIPALRLGGEDEFFHLVAAQWTEPSLLQVRAAEKSV